jgi:site-specific DNA-methyltransferase (adenine-specific)
MTVNLYHGDCMEAMKAMPDKTYQLCIVDPPYGIGEASGREASRNNSPGRAQTPVKYAVKEWDKQTPPAAFFSELRRVSVNQIIWGGNFFLDHLPSTSCMIVWDKLNSGDFADCELAWTSFKTAVRKVSFMWNGMLQGDMKNKEKRIHPTQKPVRLYEWLLNNYAKPGDKILDTHCGSGSILIACDIMGYDIDAYEIDLDYFTAAKERLERHQAQGKLFG